MEATGVHSRGGERAHEASRLMPRLSSAPSTSRLRVTTI
jgi:hypothetical protein